MDNDPDQPSPSQLGKVSSPMPGYAGYPLPPSQPKKSFRWLWILLSLLGGLLLLSCGSCGLCNVNNFNSSNARLFGDPGTDLGIYYQFVQQQEYEVAYDYLSPDAVFSIDGQDVPITSLSVFTTTEQGLNSKMGLEDDHMVHVQVITPIIATLSVTVSRGYRYYTELVTMTKTGRPNIDPSPNNGWYVSHETITSVPATATP